MPDLQNGAMGARPTASTTNQTASDWYLISGRGGTVVRVGRGMVIGETETGELDLFDRTCAQLELDIGRDNTLILTAINDHELELAGDTRSAREELAPQAKAQITLANNLVQLSTDFVDLRNSEDTVRIRPVREGEAPAPKPGRLVEGLMAKRPRPTPKPTQADQPETGKRAPIPKRAETPNTPVSKPKAPIEAPAQPQAPTQPPKAATQAKQEGRNAPATRPHAAPKSADRIAPQPRPPETTSDKPPTSGPEAAPPILEAKATPKTTKPAQSMPASPQTQKTWRDQWTTRRTQIVGAACIWVVGIGLALLYPALRDDPPPAATPIPPLPAPAPTVDTAMPAEDGLNLPPAPSQASTDLPSPTDAAAPTDPDPVEPVADSTPDEPPLDHEPAVAASPPPAPPVAADPPADPAAADAGAGEQVATVAQPSAAEPAPSEAEPPAPEPAPAPDPAFVAELDATAQALLAQAADMALRRDLLAADLAMRQGHLVAPLEASAYSYYQRALAKDPDSVEAQQGIVAIQSELVNQALANLAGNNLDAAREALDGAALTGGNPLMVEDLTSEVDFRLRLRDARAGKFDSLYPSEQLVALSQEPPAPGRGNDEITVEAEFTVSETGEVQDITLLGDPPPRIAREAERALGTWRFEPVLFNGRPLPVRSSVQLVFRG